MNQNNLANMIATIKNAIIKKDTSVEIMATYTNRKIADILVKKRFIQSLRTRQFQSNSTLILELKYQGTEKYPYITSFKQISKPGLKIYTNKKHIPKLLGGIGTVILSTSQGIMSDHEARLKGIGGEILCYIW